jgi:hypothetical protein
MYASVNQWTSGPFARMLMMVNLYFLYILMNNGQGGGFSIS